MSILDLFSKRQKRLRGECPDVYTYDKIPNVLRVQIVHIWWDILGNQSDYCYEYKGVRKVYKFIVESLCREYGVFSLNRQKKYGSYSHIEELCDFFLQEEDTAKVIDVIEITFKVADRYMRSNQYTKDVDAGIIELNTRFKEHGIGYQFEESEMIRVDSQLLHTETVKPALKLLNGKQYAGAQDEFLSAYEHYRHGRNKEALNDALKSFESTMKAICEKRKWPYDQKDTSKRLVDICYEQKLIPSFWQQHMAALRSLLEGGVPTGRNKVSGHGQGTTPTTVPEHFVAYVLHMTAAAIVFLVKSAQAL